MVSIWRVPQFQVVRPIMLHCGTSERPAGWESRSRERALGPSFCTRKESVAQRLTGLDGTLSWSRRDGPTVAPAVPVRRAGAELETVLEP
jgi:hypothetical protein